MCKSTTLFLQIKLGISFHYVSWHIKQLRIIAMAHDKYQANIFKSFQISTKMGHQSSILTNRIGWKIQRLNIYNFRNKIFKHRIITKRSNIWFCKLKLKCLIAYQVVDFAAPELHPFFKILQTEGLSSNLCTDPSQIKHQLVLKQFEQRSRFYAPSGNWENVNPTQLSF